MSCSPVINNVGIRLQNVTMQSKKEQSLALMSSISENIEISNSVKKGSGPFFII